MQIFRQRLLGGSRLCWIEAILLGALSITNIRASPASSPSAPPISAPTPIAVSNIVTASQAVAQQLQQTQAAGADTESGQIASSLPVETTEIDSRLEETRRTLLPGASLDAMRESEGL